MGIVALSGLLLEMDCTSKYTNFVFNFQVVIDSRNLKLALYVGWPGETLNFR